MKPDQLKEAQQIVDGLAWIANARMLEVVARDTPGIVNVAKPGQDPYRVSATQMPLTKAAADAALAVLRAGWDKREGELRRRAAQIGLVL